MIGITGGLRVDWYVGDTMFWDTGGMNDWFAFLCILRKISCRFGERLKSLQFCPQGDIILIAGTTFFFVSAKLLGFVCFFIVISKEA